jgi:prepilin-type processing-associated H-X9-DG protein
MDTILGRTARAKGNRAFALVDLMIIVATVVLAAMVLPMIYQPRGCRCTRINCINNLKQVGLSFRIWSGDNNDRFPMSFYTNTTGTLKFPDATNVFRYFQVMSNELSSPKILACPSDVRLPAPDFSQLANSNISYFIGVDADETQPAMFLAGDRNLTTNGAPISAGSTAIKSGAGLGWGPKIHNGLGNVALCDGSVQELTSAAFASAAANSFTNSGTNVMRLLVP